MKLNEKSEFTLDLKTIILITGFVISLSATYFTLKADVEEAKTLPKLPISEKEFRQTILNNGSQLENQQEQLNKIEDKIDKIDERLYELNK